VLLGGDNAPLVWDLDEVSQNGSVDFDRRSRQTAPSSAAGSSYDKKNREKEGGVSTGALRFINE
jgi:hypothetical protein